MRKRESCVDKEEFIYSWSKAFLAWILSVNIPCFDTIFYARKRNQNRILEKRKIVIDRI